MIGLPHQSSNHIENEISSIPSDNRMDMYSAKKSPFFHEKSSEIIGSKKRFWPDREFTN